MQSTFLSSVCFCRLSISSFNRVCVLLFCTVPAYALAGTWEHIRFFFFFLIFSKLLFFSSSFFPFSGANDKKKKTLSAACGFVLFVLGAVHAILTITSVCETYVRLCFIFFFLPQVVMKPRIRCYVFFTCLSIYTFFFILWVAQSRPSL